jgi:aminomethyltransferase
MGPTVKKAIGMGYVDVPFNKIGSEIYVEIRGKLLKAVVVKMQFYKK